MPLQFERRGGLVQHRHQAAEFAAGIRRRDTGGEIAGAQAPRHLRDTSDLRTDAEFREQAHAGKQHDRQDRERAHVFGKTPLCGRDKLGLRTTQQHMQGHAPDGDRMGCRPDFGVAVLAGQFSGGGSVFKRKPELGRTRDGAAGLFVGPMRCRRPDKNGTLAVDQQKLDPRRQVLDLLLHQPVEIERGQKHEPQLPLFIVSRIGDLEHSRPGEPAECRLDRRRIGVRSACWKYLRSRRSRTRPVFSESQNRLPSGLMVRMPVKSGFFSRTSARNLEQAALSRLPRSRDRDSPKWSWVVP